MVTGVQRMLLLSFSFIYLFPFYSDTHTHIYIYGSPVSEIGPLRLVSIESIHYQSYIDGSH